MSKRLQVLVPDAEWAEINRLARREKITVGEWVRQALARARADRPAKDPQAKLMAVRKAVAHSFPTADIEQMNAEIERGYLK
jgi:hypothetical protein